MLIVGHGSGFLEQSCAAFLQPEREHPSHGLRLASPQRWVVTQSAARGVGGKPLRHHHGIWQICPRGAAL